MRHWLGFPALFVATIQQVSSFVPFAAQAIGRTRDGVFGFHEPSATCFTSEAHGQHQSFAQAHCGDHANDEEKKTAILGNDDSPAMDTNLSRRKLASVSAEEGLATLLAGPSIADEGTKRTVVITGANSGIGLDAAKKLVDLGHDVHVVCRTEAKAKSAAGISGAAGAFVCDLSSLASVREFVATWGGKPIDSLCMNAGMAPNTKGTVKYTKEGFELAVGTNHLAHFLLANLLLRPLEASKAGDPRLIVTASSVHDPDTPGGNVGSKATLGDLNGLERYLAATGEAKTFDMVDGAEYDGDKAYKDSKLCNVLFTLEAQRRLASRSSKVKVDCFSPGLITSTGIFRNQSPISAKACDIAATNVIKVAATVSQGGDILVNMVTKLSLEKSAGGRFFATLPRRPDTPFGVQQVSVEAQDVQKAKRLWDVSAACVGLAQGKSPVTHIHGTPPMFYHA